jgi:8-amino-7-oxononanoate synthase
MHKSHERALEALTRRGRHRALATAAGADFTSNDYLGLASSHELRDAAQAALAREVPIGAGGSRLLRGNHREHEALEAEAAAFFGAQSALFFGSGFMANVAIFSTLPQRGDVVVHDALIHASVHDGMRAGKAERAEASHNDAGAIEDAIKDWRAAGGAGTPWVAVESLYSMDGDRAPLADLMEIVDRHDGILVIDEAHATGVFGPEGRAWAPISGGTTWSPSTPAGVTAGRARPGFAGALRLSRQSPPSLHPRRRRRPSWPPVRAALLICRFDGGRRERLQARRLRRQALQTGCGIALSGSQIQPLIVGADDRAVRLAAAMQARGFDVRAVRPPTVPEGTARLRLSLTLNVDEACIEAMAGVLAEELARLGP